MGLYIIFVLQVLLNCFKTVETCDAFGKVVYCQNICDYPPQQYFNNDISIIEIGEALDYGSSVIELDCLIYFPHVTVRSPNNSNWFINQYIQ
jgi:hypothetical protein